MKRNKVTSASDFQVGNSDTLTFLPFLNKSLSIMNTSEFFESQNDISFENYLEMTHGNWSKDSLASARAILKDYVKDVKTHQQQQNPKFSRLKTTYSVNLPRLLEML